MNRSGRTQAAAWLVIGILTFSATIELYIEGSPATDLAGAFGLLLAIALAVVLLDTPSVWAAIAANVLIYEGSHLLWRAGFIRPVVERTLSERSWFAMAVWLLGTAIIIAIMKSTLEYLRSQSAKLEQRTYDLGERVKELQCLTTVTSLLQQRDQPRDDILEQIVKALPTGWQYPEVTCARIRFFDKEYLTQNFRETTWCQSEDLMVDGEVVGTVSVFYLEERAEEDEGLFLKEARNLLSAIASQIMAEVARWQARDLLEDSEKRYRLLIENVPLGIGLTTMDGKLRAWNQAAYDLVGVPHSTPLADIDVNKFY